MIMGKSSTIVAGLDDPASSLLVVIDHLEQGSTLSGDTAPRLAKSLRVLAGHLAPYQSQGFFRFLEFYNTAQRPTVFEAVAAYNADRPEGFPPLTAEEAIRGIEALRVSWAGRAA